MARLLAICVMILLTPALCIRPVYAGEDVVFLDASGNALRPGHTDELSLSATCGDCHSVSEMAGSVHYNRKSPSQDLESVDCLSCHRPTFDSGGAIKHLSRLPEEDTCLSCHPEAQREMRSLAKGVHAQLSCMECHTDAGHKDSGRPSCQGCHMGRRAQRPVHCGFTRNHLKSIPCVNCHAAGVGAGGIAAHGVAASSRALGARGCTQCHGLPGLSDKRNTLRRNGVAGAVREGIVKPAAPWALGILMLVCALHYGIFGPTRVMSVRGEPKVERFSALERAVHALVASCFVFLGGTGLGFILHCDAPDDPWRGVHGVVGGVFVVSLVAMLVMWQRQARFVPCDRTWLRSLGGYLGRSRHCPAGKFNAGQKLFYWLIAAGAGTLVCATGCLLILWRGGASGWVFTLHDMAAVGMLLGLAGHLYLSMWVNPGALSAIITGFVPESWARSHHTDWLFKQPSNALPGEHPDGKVY